MRIIQKKELLQCIETLKKANKKLLSVHTNTRVAILLQCQGLAIEIGNKIEQIEGEGTVSVSYLEDYCEEVYQASIVCDEPMFGVSHKRLARLLSQIENSIWNDIPESPAEIVFIPYKAAMWDALDSIYRAAIQDKKCHVIVMPIPYYNMNRQSGQVEIHYEGNLFPADIPITDFRKYSLEMMSPDAIFIHNPYDEYNRVTQVPEKYFSSYLINYTEHLVYVPYFVTRGDTIKEDYCRMPAVKNAWRTFVQSENVRKCYIKYGAASEKIVAMGSPKFDMVVKMQENPPEIPAEWKDALSGRKIFLLNTHLNPIINETEKVIDKLHSIFDLFKQRDDAALLWRPHPLSIETAKSMNPRILEEYMKLIDEFHSLRNGVYDDTADVHRAIAISDAYVGDWSSLVTMYGMTGKPIYILSVKSEINIRIQEKDRYLQFACGAIQSNAMWVPSEDHNGLYRIDMLTNKAQYITCFEEEGIFCKELYHRIVLYKDKLFLIPWRAKYIAVYHIKSGEKEYLIPDYESTADLPKFSEAVQYEKYLFLFPARVSVIVRLDMETGEMKCFNECCRELEQITYRYATFFNGICEGNKAWVTSRKSNCLIEFDMKQEENKKYFLECSKNELIDIASDGQQFYVLNKAGEVISWENGTNENRVIWKYAGEIDDTPFYRIVWLNDYLWLLPGRENKIVKINIYCSDQVEELCLPTKYTVRSNEKTRTIDYMIKNEKILICPVNADMMLTIDCSSNTVCGQMICLDGSDSCNSLTEYRIHHPKHDGRSTCGYLYKEDVCPLEYFVNCIIAGREKHTSERRRNFQNMQANAEGSCGEKIWKYVWSDLIREDKKA